MTRAFGSSIFRGATESAASRICAYCGDRINGVGYLERDADGKKKLVHPGECAFIMRERRRDAEPVGTLVRFHQEHMNGADIRIVRKFKNGRLRAEFIQGRRPYYALEQITIDAEQFAPAQKEQPCNESK